MSKRAIDSVAEKSVALSFTSIGPRLRKRLFGWTPLEQYDLAGRVIVLTGGTSGIGEKAAELYASLGAELVIVARNPDKTASVIDALKQSTGNTSLSSVIADLGKADDVHRAAAELAERHQRIDVLAHNAGALFNERKRTDDGTDLAVELMVATPFLLTGLLLPQLTAQPGQLPGRVLTMSSGGMYTEALTVDGLEMDDAEYQGAKQYARAKRAQVSLNETWSVRIPKDQIVFHSLHPGWVNTPGITEALPGFAKVLNPLGLLRNAREGADTLVWLSADDEPLASSGKFWLDREPRDTHKLSSTRQSDTAARREKLWQWCEQHTGWVYPGE